MLPCWRAAPLVVTDIRIVATATRADRWVMSGSDHLQTVCLQDLICGKKKDLPAVYQSLSKHPLLLWDVWCFSFVERPSVLDSRLENWWVPSVFWGFFGWSPVWASVASELLPLTIHLSFENTTWFRLWHKEMKTVRVNAHLNANAELRAHANNGSSRSDT